MKRLLCCRSALTGAKNDAHLERRSADQQQDASPGARRLSSDYKKCQRITEIRFFAAL